MPFVANKLPHGLSVPAGDGWNSFVLRGANNGENLKNPSDNGDPTDNEGRYHGYGLTQLSDTDAASFAAWSNAVLYKNGNKADGKLDQPFPALDNGSILGPFKTKDEARKEIEGVAGIVTTGFEGIDPTKEGVEKMDDAPATARRAE